MCIGGYHDLDEEIYYFTVHPAVAAATRPVNNSTNIAYFDT